MKISELKAREDFDTILLETLTRGWREQYGTDIELSRTPVTGGQAWLIQPFLSVLYSPPVARRVRRFIADSIRFTPVRWRRIPQFVAGTFLASKCMMRLAADPFVWLRPALANAAEMVVLPGNRRVRVFDFATGKSRVFLKAGFSPVAMQREIEVRGHCKGPFVGLSTWNEEATWLEEPILDGFSLPRCPPWRDRTAYLKEAIVLLERWLAETSRIVDAQDYLGPLEARISEMLNAELAATSQLRTIIRRQMKRALSAVRELDQIKLVRSHGDFQSGNIFVCPPDTVSLIDWEYSKLRSRFYDAFTFAFETRRPTDSLPLIRRFVHNGEFPPTLEGILALDDFRVRRAVTMLFLVEELEWILEDSIQRCRSLNATDFEAVIRAITNND